MAQTSRLLLATLLCTAACTDGPASQPNRAPLGSRAGALTLAVPGDYASIQAAVDAAAAGDVVVIAAGTYTEDLTLRSGIDVRGGSMDTTTVYGSVTADGVTAATLSHLTIRGDLDPDRAGINALNAEVAINDARVTGFRWNVVVAGNLDRTSSMSRSFIERSADVGIQVTGAAGINVFNSVVSVNQAHGLHITTGATGSVDVIHSLFWGNGWPSQGAGVLADEPTLILLNTIVTSNRRGLDCADACTNNNSIIWGNFDDYTRSAAPGPSNIARDPLLANLNDGDFRLTQGSPAIDAASFAGGDALVGFGEPRNAQNASDIGPYEFPQEVSANIRITEVMANPVDERRGEFIELHNTSDTAIDVTGWTIDDGDSVDTLVAWPGTDATIAGGGFAVVLDPDYDPNVPTFHIADGAVWLTVASSRTLGSGLSTGDPVALYDGSTLLDRFSHPFDAGNGISVEIDSLEDGDVLGNWLASPCGASPGAANCAWQAAQNDASTVVITEVMANPLSERSGEYVEVYNLGTTTVDLAGWVLDDGDSTDMLTGWEGGATTIAPGSYGIILDPNFAADFVIAADATWLTITASATLGNALSTNDPIALRDSLGAHVDAFGHPSDPGNGVSIERISPDAGDVASNWVPSRCETGGSPGSGTCGVVAPPDTARTIAITEVMANALDEDTGEFIELYNFGDAAVDLAGWQIDDGDKREALRAFDAGATALLQPGAFALVLDSEYVDGTYTIGSNVLRLRTPDSSTASGLATTDPITLYDTAGNAAASWSSPFNPGNGVSAEQVDPTVGDVASNWIASSCNASPGALTCDTGTPLEERPLMPTGIVINEVMANPLNEGTGEFVELYNAGDVAVSLRTLAISDGSARDPLYADGTALLQPGQYAIILDSDYVSGYAIPDDVLVARTFDKHLGNGLSTADTVTLYGPDDVVLSTYGNPANPGNGWSRERISPTAPDTGSSWVKAGCEGGSPGLPNCAATTAPTTALSNGTPCDFGAVECSGGVCLAEALTYLTLCSASCESTSCGDGFDCVATADTGWSEVCWPSDGGPVEPGPQAPRLLLTELAVTPGAAEFVELHNPTGVSVDLSGIYLADYPDYHAITTGGAAPNSSDMRVRFPDGAQISAGGYVTVSLESASHFESEYGMLPDYDLVAVDPAAPAMVGQFSGNAGLSNGGEMLVLFAWDGVSALVTDLDYVVYGDNQDGMDKTGVSVGTAAYEPEQRWLDQRAAPSPGTSGSALARCDLDETGQLGTGGNGRDGADHTSEPFPDTWQVADASPGAANAPCGGACTPTCTGVCGDDGCGGACGTCSGDTYCEVDQCQAIATGLTLTTVRKGYGGF
ncbi:MAG: hypothetical protein ACI9MR_002581, partial [Myxococcota bacterium]